jgi:hypothetical protein
MAETLIRKRSIYGVSVAGQQVRLVRARTQAQALQFVIGSTVFIGRPTEEQLIDLTKQGVEVEDIPEPADLLAAAQAERAAESGRPIAREYATGDAEASED